MPDGHPEHLLWARRFRQLGSVEPMFAANSTLNSRYRSKAVDSRKPPPTVPSIGAMIRSIILS
ncbi:uncharacterized protein METZ01_LOCUS155639 [marine metagenome]|uniref:Uncharacterized protein n=1 Tax=marine metagenome TaxID=408172 RepID=A0A382AMJ2_9ZZZZ